MEKITEKTKQKIDNYADQLIIRNTLLRYHNYLKEELQMNLEELWVDEFLNNDGDLLDEETLLIYGFKVKSASVMHNYSFIKNEFVIQQTVRGKFYYDGIEIEYLSELKKYFLEATGMRLTINTL